MKSSKFYKKNKDDSVLWAEPYADGEFEFTFDREHIFNLFRDYPWQLTAEQKAIFDRENPFWADFFADRSGQ